MAQVDRTPLTSLDQGGRRDADGSGGTKAAAQGSRSLPAQAASADV